MKHSLRLILASSILISAALPAAGQKFLPKSIQFKGDPEYSDQELMAAAGLKKGEVLSYAEMNEHSKRLMDTGVFAGLYFKFDGQDLIFQLTPAAELYPIRLDNLPLTPGKELDAKLHAMLPLFHADVPSEGGLMEDVRGALEQILAADGIKASVTATPVVNPHLHRVSAIDYSIATPQVRVAVSRVDGVSADYLPQVQGIAQEAAKIPFDTEHSEGNLESAFAGFYQDRGYAAVKVNAARSGHVLVTADAIVVPFSVAIQEGKVYKVGSVHLPVGTPVTQAEVDKLLAPRAGGPVEGVRLRMLWGLVASRYKSKGNLDCKVTPRATFDDAAGTVSYDVEVEPGPVYHLGFVKFDNVSDEMRTQLIHNWEMLPGDPFNEGYVSNFIAKIQQADPVLKRSLAGVKVKFDASADPETHDVNLVIHLEKP
ncbi:MAG: hypothetical protein KGM96_04760 [Acidobacteriota bacterium]|nr:hypothetical protein [Acidobacteriota bacterium]